jgi:glycosidase
MPKNNPSLVCFGDPARRAGPWEFHISKKCRDRYRFPDRIYSFNGNVIFADLKAARTFAERINAGRDKPYMQPAELNAMALIDEILHYVAFEYHRTTNPRAWAGALDYLRKKMGERSVAAILRRFAELFPPSAVHQKRMTADQYLAVANNVQITLEELLFLNLANRNPAFRPFGELFDDRELRPTRDYKKIVAFLEEYFLTQPLFGPDRQALPDLLQAPMRAAPDSLAGQLDYIRTRWRSLLADQLLEKFLKKLMQALDFIKETKTRHRPGPGPVLVPEFKKDEAAGGDAYYHDEERFTPDMDWMPGVVMLAKHTYVWLDQLARKYGRPVSRLDEIPDEELDRIAGWGINALWLIGLWERSRASQKIKQRCGNPEGLASAYAIYDYTVAGELGGEPAFDNLKERGRRRGIRIAVDMVPNHTGIFSRWMIEHPDWFIQVDRPPFSRYTFDGPDLSDDSRVGIFLEDGYWTRSDAAVVFKRVDKATGEIRYIYHGNDGTGMPWNDTAQLNFLLSEVRTAVLGQILGVARRSPIIRLDAAMTLTKKHFQRLWFPEPGTGGDIPSRAEHGLTRRQFNRMMPKEFWREVVDRVNLETTDTLLLAEAFWLLEGYFVRNLGMHRVYNSAFMNMLKNEENANYRKLVKNTLEFNPEILKRYVNFMSNPDEAPAIAQFGNGDKYFGVALMMVTMPGLPLFGHGQIEGLSEKYGMEYQRSYWRETPDQELVRRHDRDIFPAVKKRRLFAGADNFRFYDFQEVSGAVNENVFAYSNQRDGERALVIYNNKYETAQGWIKTSAPRNAGGVLVRQTVDQGLGLDRQNGVLYAFRDLKSDLHYLRAGKEIADHGFFIRLDGFQFHVFTDFREIRDNAAGEYGKLCLYLNGQGVPALDEALQEMKHAAVLNAFRSVANPDVVQNLLRQPDPDLFFLLVSQFYAAVKKYTAAAADIVPLVDECTASWRIINYDLSKILYEPDERIRPAAEYIRSAVPVEKRKKILLIWLAVEGLGKLKTGQDFGKVSVLWFDQWLFAKTIRETFASFGWAAREASRNTRLVRLLTAFAHDFERTENVADHLLAMLENGDVQNYLGVNLYNGVRWFHKESFEELLGWLFILTVITILKKHPADRDEADDAIEAQYRLVQKLRDEAAACGYRLETFQKIIV